jgi:hypothetical protein
VKMSEFIKNQKAKMNPPAAAMPPGMLLRVYLSDGSVHPFIQTDKAKTQQMWASIEPARFFTQLRLVVAGTHSKSVFVCSEIVRLDLVEIDCSCWKFPEGFSDVVELSEPEFRKNAHLDQLELMPERERPTPAGNLLVSFLKLHFQNYAPIFLMAELLVKLPAENLLYMHFLLSKAALHMRLKGGGVGIVNLAQLAGYTVYPGVAEVPADAWLAEPKPSG